LHGIKIGEDEEERESKKGERRERQRTK